MKHVIVSVERIVYPARPVPDVWYNVMLWYRTRNPAILLQSFQSRDAAEKFVARLKLVKPLMKVRK